MIFARHSLYVIYECLWNTYAMFPLYVVEILGQKVCLNAMNGINSRRMKSVLETTLKSV